ncbi:LTA synthase family protein [Marinobacter sp.]|uniref:LTA synthase family protein n=1 Tax=Marinobacter sp. TaxID=50741 RepID=UPI003568F8D0
MSSLTTSVVATGLALARLPLSVLAFAVGAFFVCRTGLLVFHHNYFANLSLMELIYGYVQGIKFDLSITVIALSPALLLMSLPITALQNPRWLQVLAWLSGVVLLALLGLYMADIAYFGEVNRHLGQELFRLDSDLGAVVEIASTSRLPSTILSLSLIVFFAVLWHRWVVRPVNGRTADLPANWWQRSAIWLVLIIMLTWFGRGLVVVSKPIDVVDAFTESSQEQANLALNGAFVALKAIDDDERKPLSFFSQTEFDRIAQQQPAEPFKYTPDSQAPRNVIVFMLESWSYEYIDGLAGKGYGVTPFMDRLIERSQVWTRFYAAGQRSIQGIQAALTSVPVLESQPALGYGLELNRMSRIAAIARQQNYETVMIQSSNRRSFHMDGIAKSLGFEHYYGKEDFPLRRDYPQPTPRFGWDHETMAFLGGHLSSKTFTEKPFFAFLFTGTTHEPFADPGQEFHNYEHDPSGLGGFLNTLRYSDWSIEQFMNHAQSQPWYENTVFIFTADHVLRASDVELGNQFHIPLVIFTPDGSLTPARKQQVASQYDLLPTLADLLGIASPVYTFGESLLSPATNAAPLPAMVSKGAVTGMIHACGTSVFTEAGLIGKNASNEPGYCQFDEAQERLQWRMQLADKLLRKNQWIPATEISSMGSPPEDGPG